MNNFVIYYTQFAYLWLSFCLIAVGLGVAIFSVFVLGSDNERVHKFFKNGKKSKSNELLTVMRRDL